MKGSAPSGHAGSREEGTAGVSNVIEIVPVHLNVKRILVPVDFSQHSKRALEYALPLAEQFGAHITLIHVVEPVVFPADDGFASAGTFITTEVALRKDASARLASLANAASRAQVRVEPLVRAGSPYHEITTAAAELKADLIIIATHGYTGLKHVLLESTAERVVRHAPCPVFVVRNLAGNKTEP